MREKERATTARKRKSWFLKNKRARVAGLRGVLCVDRQTKMLDDFVFF